MMKEKKKKKGKRAKRSQTNRQGQQEGGEQEREQEQEEEARYGGKKLDLRCTCLDLRGEAKKKEERRIMASE